MRGIAGFRTQFKAGSEPAIPTRYFHVELFGKGHETTGPVVPEEERVLDLTRIESLLLQAQLPVLEVSRHLHGVTNPNEEWPGVGGERTGRVVEEGLKIQILRHRG